MLRGTDIVCISSIDWDFIWQGHQEIMATLAAQGNRVLFIENTGVRAPRWRDLPRLRRRLRNWREGTKGFREIRPNLFVYSPLILPFPYSRPAGWVNRQLLFRALQRWQHATGFHCSVAWTFLPTPIVRELLRALEPEVTIYYCIDDLASSSSQARRIRASEERLFQEADLVFVTSEKLRQHAAQFNRHVHLFPFGVDFERFERVRQQPADLPADLRSLPRPIIGYVGGIHQWVDQELLVAVASRLPQVSFVLVGPPQTDVSRLSRQPNIHLFQARPHADVPRYIKGFDVGIISYRLTRYTDHVYPTKLNEYLAMGIPVVATGLPEIHRFNAEHGPVVTIAESPEAFAQALGAAVGEASPEVVRRRIAVAKENSWTARITQMSALIEAQLEIRRAVGPRWPASLRRLYRTAHTHAMRLNVGALALYLLVFHSPAVWWAAAPLRVAAAPRSADAIVVFAGGVGESGKAGGGYQERVKQAADLYHQGFAGHLIFSSGYTFVFREAEVMKELAVLRGVPASAILLETEAANTHQNVRFVADLMRQRGWRSILLVSSPYHMRRALLTWGKAAPEVVVTPVPVPMSQFYVHDHGASWEQLRGILHEYASILSYWWRGWI